VFRGEFRFKNGLVIPNNLTAFGRLEILRMAFAGNTRALTAAGANFHVGLCTALPSDSLMLENLAEPTLGVNGYARIAVSRDGTGWPTDGYVDGEAYIESKDLVFAAVTGNFSKPVSRLFICQSSNAVTGNVIALSADAPAAFTITPSTPLVDRTFNYRIYDR
jgi:hypothetical protein